MIITLPLNYRLANALPKHWAGREGGAASISEQLRNKQSRHNLLLQVLQKIGFLSQIKPDVLK